MEVCQLPDMAASISRAKYLIANALQRRDEKAQQEAARRNRPGRKQVSLEPVRHPTGDARCVNRTCQFKRKFKEIADWRISYYGYFCPFCNHLGKPVYEGQQLQLNWEDVEFQSRLEEWMADGFKRPIYHTISPADNERGFKAFNTRRCEELKPLYVWTAYIENDEQIARTVTSIDHTKMADAHFPEPSNCNPMTCKFKGRSCFVGFQDGGAAEGRCRLGMMLCGIQPTSQRIRARNREVKREIQVKVSARLRLKDKLKGIRGRR